MDEPSKTFAPEVSAAEAKKWIGRLLIAVLMGEAIWGFVVTVTNDLVVPAMAGLMGGDPQSPLYLGKGDISVVALFTSTLELCFAGILAVLINSWSQRQPRRRRVAGKSAAVVSSVPVAALPSAPAQSADSSFSQPEALSTPPPAVAPVPAPATTTSKPAKPSPPKTVYYNIAGEPVDADDQS